MNCKICNSATKVIFSTEVIQKYSIKYYQCEQCQFIQTEKPYWLNEAYQNTITSLDIGYATRNIMLAEVVSSIIKSSFNKKEAFIDYGGGYGLFVRIMRDKGFDFYLEDPYCQNIFANFFDTASLKNKNRFELLTAFEVFEHLEDPHMEIDKMFQSSDSLLFTTELQPSHALNNINDWWYFTPETGQHISLYSKKSLEVIAKKYQCNLYSNNSNLHLLTRKKLTFNTVKIFSVLQFYKDKFFSRNFQNKKSLLQADYLYIQQQLAARKKENIPS